MKKVNKFRFILSIIMFFSFSFLVNLNNEIENYSENNKRIINLKNLNKEFNLFLLTKTAFINYDVINIKMKEFEENLTNLKNSKYLNTFKFKNLLNTIENNFQKKKKKIEFFKSENAQFIYSIHYLYDLNNNIKNNELIDKKTIEEVHNLFDNFTKFYINDSIYFKNYKINNKTNNKIVNQFSIILNKNVKRIKKYKEIRSIIIKEYDVVYIDKLFNLINNRLSKSIFFEKILIIILFLSLITLMFLLIRQNNKALILKDELLEFKTAIENSYNSIIVTDENQNIIYANEEVEKKTGYKKEFLMGKNPRILQSGLNTKEFYRKLFKTLSKHEKWEGVFINKRKNGSLLYEKSSIMPIIEKGVIKKYIAIKMDITNYIEEKNKVKHMAFHDSLTELPNRLHIEEILKDKIKNNDSSKFAVLFIDLDKFKIINDTLGHDIGDEVLIESSKKIKKCLRKKDYFGRVGGDEFIVLIEYTNKTTVSEISSRIMKSFDKSIQTKQHILNLSLSIGISLYPEDDKDYKLLLKYSDIAMYEAKSQGRNTFRYYNKELSVKLNKRLDLEQNLKYSLSNNEIYMNYQPQYDLITKEIVSLEALVRWNNKNMGFVSPVDFINIAEETGFIIPLGLFIFKQSCIDFVEFKKTNKNLKNISINISTVQLYQKDFIQNILNIIKQTKISIDNITIEITESHIMKNIEHSVELLNKIHQLGFKISIDDFGTGYSSLNYLKQFPIFELKIDKSFIDGVTFNKSDIAISKTILMLSKTMGYINVAEGIETKEQEIFLIENNCKLGQGYYYSKPKSKNDLITFFLNNKINNK